LIHGASGIWGWGIGYFGVGDDFKIVGGFAMFESSIWVGVGGVGVEGV
jgi:hypothetical protein